MAGLLVTRKSKRYGTYSFGGMATNVVEHLLADGQLTEAQNILLDPRGALRSTKMSSQVEGLDDFFANGMTVLDDGTLAYKAGDIYTVGSTTYDSDNYNAADFLSIGGRAYVADSVQNLVWDGTSWRNHGPPDWEPAFTSCVAQARDTLGTSISSVSQANPAVVTTSGAISPVLAAGDRVYISGVSTMTEVNDRVFTVGSFIPTNIFTLADEDSTGYAGAGSGGTADRDGVGRTTGIYKYAISYTLTMPGGDVIETELFPITYLGEDTFDLDDTGKPWEITAGHERLFVKANQISLTQVSNYLHTLGDSGQAIGVDVLVGANVWRTKDGGSTYYLMYEADHSEVYGAGSPGYVVVYDSYSDLELGEVWDENADANGLPPVSSFLAHASNRVFCNDTSNPKHLHFSKAFGPDYFSPTDYHVMPEEITALGTHNEDLIVFGENKIWRYTDISGIGDFQRIDAEGGCPYFRATVDTPHGLFFANDRGVYVYRGVQPVKVSLPVQDTMRTLIEAYSTFTGWDAAYCDGRVYFAMRGGVLFILDLDHPNGPQWSYFNYTGWDTTPPAAIQHVAGRSTDSWPYLCGGYRGIKQFEGGTTYSTSIIETKDWGEPGRYVTVDYVYIDIETLGGGGVSVFLKGPRDTTETLATGLETTGREVRRLDVSGDRRDLFSIRITGQFQLYGIWVDTVMG